MPFTIGGEWVPESSKKPSKPITLRKEKRRSSYVTIIMHLPNEMGELKKICSELKKELGCGGSVKEETIELQGDQVEAVKKYLKSIRNN